MHNRTGHAEDYKQEPRTDTRRLIQFPEFPQNATLTVYTANVLHPPPLLTSIYRDIQKVNRLDAQCLDLMSAESFTSSPFTLTFSDFYSQISSDIFSSVPGFNSNPSCMNPATFNLSSRRHHHKV